MILDTLDHWKDYGWENDRFKAGFEYICNLKADVKDGKYELDGENLFCMIQTYDTRPMEGSQFEAHRQYADIQFLLAGEEKILWAPIPELTVAKPYEPDAEMYDLKPDATALVLTAGRFSVFRPQDAHAPCIMHGKVSEVKKAVVKVRVA